MSKFNALAGKTAGTAAPSAPAPAGPVQIDGNVIAQQAKPTKAPLASREASPSNYGGRSGMENAMGDLADKLHPRKGR